MCQRMPLEGRGQLSGFLCFTLLVLVNQTHVIRIEWHHVYLLSYLSASPLQFNSTLVWETGKVF